MFCLIILFYLSQELVLFDNIVLFIAGTLVIENERRRVEELKRRVADEVKAQWEERKAKEQRDVNCASLNSVGSEDSSLTSSDLHTERLMSLYSRLSRK